LSTGTESCSPYENWADYPLLLQCDHAGRVLWMSKRTRQLLGNPEHLVETMALNAGRTSMGLWRIWHFHDSVIIGILPLQFNGDASGGLIDLQESFLTHFFQLLIAERRLFQQTRFTRRGSGRKAIRQMELERRRLGRELHTGAGQMLAAIRIQLELIAAEMPEASSSVQQALERISVLAANTLEQVRAISKRLHPPEWQRLTLHEAIRQLWEISGVPQRFQATLDLDPLPAEPDLEVKVLLYRAMQEALSNLSRHSKATRVRANLHCQDRLTLSIVDDGIGFDVEKVLHSPGDIASGIGLRSIREQAEVLGGKLIVESSPTGTKLEVTVALSPGDGETAG